MTARAKYDATSAHAMAMRDIAGKLRALIVALGDDGDRLAAAYREVAAAEAALADDAAKAYAEVPRAPTTDADRERVVREVRGVLAERPARVLVHADGGACHGTPIVDGRCPKCGIAPDTQSLEMWPQADPPDAGVISDMDRPVVLSPADADRVAALIEERPGPTEAMRALFAERRPCAGWVDISSAIRQQSTTWTDPNIAVWKLPDANGNTLAEVRDWIDGDGNYVARWLLDDDRHGNEPTLDAAMIAAEDSLRAIAAEILRAVGS